MGNQLGAKGRGRREKRHLEIWKEKRGRRQQKGEREEWRMIKYLLSIWRGKGKKKVMTE